MLALILASAAAVPLRGMAPTYQFRAGLHLVNERSRWHEHFDWMLLPLDLHARQLLEFHGMLRRTVGVAGAHKPRKHWASIHRTVHH